MKTYTVIGLHDETGEVTAHHIRAADPHRAMRYLAGQPDAPSQIIGAIEGEHEVTCPCEDAGKAAYVEDLR